MVSALALTPRWPLYLAEIAFYIAAFTLSIILRARRKTGWREIIILWPWLMMGIGYSAYLLFEAYTVHGDPLPTHNLAWWGNVIYMVSGLSLAIFLGARLTWKTG